MKKGFSLITAIVFIVLVATIGALALSFATQTVKQTTDLYLKTQAELLAYSATEYALLAISGNNRSSNCLNKINAQQGDFNIEVDIKYILTAETAAVATSCNKLADDILTQESDVTVLIDTFVTNNVTGQDIRFHRRTLQKP